LLLFVPCWLRHAIDFVESGCACGVLATEASDISGIRTAVTVPVKVVLGVAGALVVETVLLASRAMRERHVVVGDVVEEVELILVQHQSSSDGVHGRIAPAFIEEATGLIQRREEVNVRVRAKPVQVTNLEVGPEMAVVVGLAPVVAEELHRVVLDDVLREVLGEVLGSIPKRRNGLDVLVQAEGEAVLLLVVGHVLEGIVVDVAEQLDAGLHAPVPLVVEHQGMAEEEARLVAAHVPVADGVAVDDLLLLHLLAHLGGLVLVNPLGEGPMLLGDLAILGRSGNQRSGDLLELVVKLVIVEEDPVVVELAVEAVLDVANRLGDLPDVGVASEGDKGRVHTAARSGGGRERLLVRRCEHRRREGIKGSIGGAGRGGSILVGRPARGGDRR
jgi:hypothetical protein